MPPGDILFCSHSKKKCWCYAFETSHVWYDSHFRSQLANPLKLHIPRMFGENVKNQPFFSKIPKNLFL